MVRSNEEYLAHNGDKQEWRKAIERIPGASWLVRRMRDAFHPNG